MDETTGSSLRRLGGIAAFAAGVLEDFLSDDTVTPALQDSNTPKPWCTPLRCACFLTLVGVGTYATNIDGSFIYDDAKSVVDNTHIRRLWPPWGLFQAPLNGPTQGRPVASLSFAVNYAVGGLDVRGYHLTNIAIHIAGALVLFGVVRRTLLGPAG